MNEYFQVINLVLNLLILPLMAMIWSVRIELAKVDARLTAILESHGQRITNLEAFRDKQLTR